MEEQKLPQPFFPEKNGKKPQPSLPVYTTPFLVEHPADELNLRQLLTVVRRRGVAIASVAIAVTAMVWFSTLRQTPQYEGKFRLLVEPVTADSKLAGLTEATGANLQESGLDYDTQIQVLQSPELMERIIKQMRTRYSDIDYGSLLGNLTITRFQETKIIEVRYRDADPQKIQFVLQHLSKGYLNYSLVERQTNLRQGIQFVNKQLEQLNGQVNLLQKDLQGFRERYNFIDPEVKAGQLSGEVSTIEQQRLDTQKQLAETRAVYATLLNSSGAGSALNDAPIYQKLLTQLRDVESQMAAELVRYRGTSPVLQALQRQRDNLVPLLRQEAGRVLGNKLAEVTNQISVLEVRAAAIAQAQNRLNQQVEQLPALARRYTDLQRNLKVATDSLNRFLEKRQSLQIDIAQKEVPWQQIEASQRPQVPISPNVPRNLMLGAIAGILAGLGAAFLAERLDNVHHSPDELKNATKLPLLGVIPFHKELKKLAAIVEAAVVSQSDGGSFTFRNLNKARIYNNFPFLVAFRSLHTNIGFLGSDTPIRSVVVSSAGQADGKSTVAAYLAQAASEMGRRVLLVDADLRLPQIHTLLNLPNEQGLSNAISTNLPLEEVIQRSLSSDNLFVLTAGQIPPDPTKLLSSKKMQHIMNQLRQDFDLIIYDTPPLLGLADSSLLATHTDGMVLVVRLGKTDRSMLTQALDGLKISRASVLGLVANGVKNYNITSYNYNYRYQTRSVGFNLPKQHNNTR